MLNKKENAVMTFLFSQCKKNGACLLTEQEIILGVSHKVKLSESALKNTVESLAQDGYVDVVYSDKNGEKVLVIKLLNRGNSYPREKVQQARNVKFKIFWTVVGAGISFILGKILLYIFK